MNRTRNDPVKMRILSGQMSDSAKKWRQQIDELTKAHAKMRMKCHDRRIDEFSLDFKKAVSAVTEIEKLLSAISKHLDEKADEYTKFQNT